MQLRDYEEWHRYYDDPRSGLSWRMRTVQSWIAEAIDAHQGPMRIVSSCAGDGRDVLGVLAGRDDMARFDVTMIEILPVLAERARRGAAAIGARVEVRQTDAGVSDAYAGAVPADLVLLVGIFGNISEDDIEATIRFAPALCAPGATLLWSRGRHRGDINDTVRGWFGSPGFTELEYATAAAGGQPALGRVRYDGAPVDLEPGHHLFTFTR